MEPTTWQPIETAPRDGTVILTDDEFVCFNKGRGHVRDACWYLCHMNGKLVDDITYGMVQVDPKWWMPIPPIPVDKYKKVW